MNTQSSLADVLEQSMQQHAAKPAFSCAGKTLTFAEVDALSRNLAAWLQAQPQLHAGDRIAIQLPNLLQYPVAAYAALRAGFTIVNINPQYTPAEMRHQFKDSGAKALIILQDLLPKYEQIKDDCDISIVLTTNVVDLMATDVESTPLLAAINSGEKLPLQPRPQAQVDDLCVLQYTGGTTGVSKGAMLSNQNLLSNSEQTYERLFGHLTKQDEIFISPLPLYHIYAFTLNLVLFASQGQLSVLIPNPRDLDAFVNAIKPHKFTGFSGINTLFVALCNHPEFKKLDFSSLRLTISGGSTLTSSAAFQWQQLTGCTISEGYGLSETSPVVCLNQPGHELLGSIGHPVKNTDVRLIDINGDDVKPGEAGELIVKGPQVMLGYWQRPEATADTMTKDGYFKTGDIAERLGGGEFKIVDRLKDMICVSGFNVYPNEVEEVLSSHPNIIEAAVVGKPCDHSGEKVCAYITVNAELSDEDVIAHCRQHLTGYKIPKVIRVIEELPKSTVGKILRRSLRQHSEE